MAPGRRRDSAAESLPSRVREVCRGAASKYRCAAAREAGSNTSCIFAVEIGDRGLTAVKWQTYYGANAEPRLPSGGAPPPRLAPDSAVSQSAPSPVRPAGCGPGERWAHPLAAGNTTDAGSGTGHRRCSPRRSCLGRAQKRTEPATSGRTPPPGPSRWPIQTRAHELDRGRPHAIRWRFPITRDVEYAEWFRMSPDLSSR